MPAFAQDAGADQAEDEEDVSIASSTGDTDTSIVVTGSRIRQDTFNSPSPIQILDAEQAIKVGVSSATELLQQAPVVNGAQIDATLNTSSGNSNATEAPPTGGTGSSNIDLRGLGVERTLIMVNGRRLGSAGARGAPSQPDISLLPLGLIERIDVITEGASAIYGADAVSGVVNVVLKDDYEGIELSGGIQRPENGGGSIETFGATFGVATDRARLMAGVEFYNRDRIRIGQRDFTAGGARSIEIGEDGTIYEIFIDGNFDNSLLDLGANTPGGDIFFFYTPGLSDTGVPNFSSFNNLPALPANARDFGDGTNFIWFPFYTDSDDNNEADLVQPLKRFSFVTLGSYDLIPEANIQAYFEGYYFEREQFIRSVNEQIFPDIPALVQELDADTGTFTGNLVDNPLNPFDFNVAPIITLDDIPQEFDVNVQQIRFVGGVRGDIPGDFFEDRGWNFDVNWSYDKGTGFVSQLVLNEERLIAATQGVYVDTNGEVGCGPIDRIGEGGFFSLTECPLINWFADSFYVGGPTGEGEFENQAQRDYLLGNRTNRTVIEQTIYSAFVSGGLFDIPTGGEVKIALGYEHRDDEIDSQNSFLGVDGSNASENPVAEGETRGSRNLDEVYAEIQIPLLLDKPFFETLQIDGAVRYTDESNFGGEETYRIRGLWRPVDWVQISGSYGTSYRAPNLREQFLASQGGGIGGGLDPCINANFATTTDFSDPSTINTINNCIASGVVFTDELDVNGVAAGDPGFLGLDGQPDTTLLGTAGITTIPTSTGGNADLEPETSTSWTATLSVAPPISSAFDIEFAVSYYDISIENSVRNLGAETIINRCFSDLDFPGLTSPFCDFITRDATASEPTRLIQNVTAGFVNIGQDSAKGIDFNTRFSANLEELFGGPDADFFINVAASYLLERETQVFDDDPIDELEGTFGIDAAGLPFSFPKWKGQMTAGLGFGDFQILTQVRYIGSQDFENELPLNTNPFFVIDPVTGTRATSTNFGQNIGSEIYQSLSVAYTYDDRVEFSLGVRNLWDNEPPIVDRSIVPQRQNALSSSGYDFVGRTFFFNTRFKL
ncbi:TonB-dependent receptor [Altererythrobacter lutimaris]|uniref:TonB-dependent receptor n=1 Tax=Altererythrobacter lutimaris TaxID=2743979 RepID=A0A850H6H2_9SPHN|nr:TonB-dependent receptor [Altererythrobacter lutimaris]NVE94757.1 TonB-dependent receptor [Altererythrobacter lutimaris]